ncbi:MAG TPA: GPR endopeptidase, partial [Lachnospiraceae bacterium]|nr:GPR endopeptidase [Lachnospiraceae bacterium]
MESRKRKSSLNANTRTDLALEIRESFEEDDVEISGVILEEEYLEDKDIKVTRVVIKDEKGQKAMNKPIGTYITIEAPRLQEDDESYHQPLSDELAKYIKELVGDVSKGEVLVAGLGNRDITPDCLGPKVVDNLFVTRHLIREFGDEFKERNEMQAMSAIAPGVMAQTGMETSEILKGIIQETKPKCI